MAVYSGFRLIDYVQTDHSILNKQIFVLLNFGAGFDFKLAGS